MKPIIILILTLSLISQQVTAKTIKTHSISDRQDTIVKDDRYSELNNTRFVAQNDYLLSAILSFPNYVDPVSGFLGFKTSLYYGIFDGLSFHATTTYTPGVLTDSTLMMGSLKYRLFRLKKFALSLEPGIGVLKNDDGVLLSSIVTEIYDAKKSIIKKDFIVQTLHGNLSYDFNDRQSLNWYAGMVGTVYSFDDKSFITSDYFHFATELSYMHFLLHWHSSIPNSRLGFVGMFRYIRENQSDYLRYGGKLLVRLGEQFQIAPSYQQVVSEVNGKLDKISNNGTLELSVMF